MKREDGAYEVGTARQRGLGTFTRFICEAGHAHRIQERARECSKRTLKRIRRERITIH